MLLERGTNPPEEAGRHLRVIAEMIANDPVAAQPEPSDENLAGYRSLAELYKLVRPRHHLRRKACVAWAAKRYITRFDTLPSADGARDAERNPQTAPGFALCERYNHAIPGAINVIQREIVDMTATPPHARRLRSHLITAFLAFVVVPETPASHLREVIQLVERWVECLRLYGAGDPPVDPSAPNLPVGTAYPDLLLVALGLSVCCTFGFRRNQLFSKGETCLC